MARSSSATDAVPARSMIVRDADVAGSPSTRTRSMSSNRRVVWTVHGPAAPRLDRGDVSSMGSRAEPVEAVERGRGSVRDERRRAQAEHPGHQLLLPRRRRAADREGSRPQPLEPAAPDPRGELVARQPARAELLEAETTLLAGGDREEVAVVGWHD